MEPTPWYSNKHTGGAAMSTHQHCPVRISKSGRIQRPSKSGGKQHVASVRRAARQHNACNARCIQKDKWAQGIAACPQRSLVTGTLSASASCAGGTYGGIQGVSTPPGSTLIMCSPLETMSRYMLWFAHALRTASSTRCSTSHLRFDFGNTAYASLALVGTHLLVLCDGQSCTVDLLLSHCPKCAGSKSNADA